MTVTKVAIRGVYQFQLFFNVCLFLFFQVNDLSMTVTPLFLLFLKLTFFFLFFSGLNCSIRFNCLFDYGRQFWIWSRVVIHHIFFWQFSSASRADIFTFIPWSSLLRRFISPSEHSSKNTLFSFWRLHQFYLRYIWRISLFRRKCTVSVFRTSVNRHICSAVSILIITSRFLLR